MTARSLTQYGIEILNKTKSNVILKLYDNSEVSLSLKLYNKLIQSVENTEPHNLELPELTFGVELEFVGIGTLNEFDNFTKAMVKRFHENYYYAGKYKHNTGDVWILGKDGSIRWSSGYGLVGYELSTPKLKLFNTKDVEDLIITIKYIREYLNGNVNDSCGTHIHLGIQNEKIFKWDIQNIIKIYSIIEGKVFDPIVPKSRRRNKYCKPTSLLQNLRDKYYKVSPRYCTFDNMLETKTIHFEFRQLEGTLDDKLILYWTTLHAYIFYDLISHAIDDKYLNELKSKNLFDFLFYYNFSSDLISYFIKRVVEFKSRTIQTS